MSKVYASRDFEISCSHFLPKYDGKCSELHGHNYMLRVTVSGDINIEKIEKGFDNAQEGMVMDFGFLKKAVKNVVDKYDHKHLNNFFSLPTAEVIAIYLYNDVKEYLPKDVTLESIMLWEDRDSFVEYRGE